ncbi:DNA-protecting protein DprA [Auraticoccus sp. F435]|uniref:DNA-protecting protein DprA n=1 Tax=Auraticoccus cholistanensis TaxID=2656650 RepID=A0A6A9UYY7_9ACTN|nr:DNA-processing protein DprA [Auraticoccus cholistanensis]MVA77094.1 DNA-protecting protein DprA [Auraticoccus cholistanensis]
MAQEDERRARMALACVAEPGDPEMSALVHERGGEEVWEAVRRRGDGSVWARRVAALELDRMVELTERCGSRFVVPGDEEWPDELTTLATAEPLADRGGVPIGLWLRGPARLGAVASRAVALVGSRAATSYGQGVATDLAADLASERVAVISGGAYGVDAAAHRGALVTGPGSTLAVLASGVDVVYPRGNAALLEEVARRGLLVSEHPPGEHPTRVRFLGRNRLIAALSQATVVVEATARSGARNTASWALRCGRVLAAVPGSVHSAQSVTPHRLIAAAEATLVTSAADVLALLAPLDAAQAPLPARGHPRLMDDWDPVAVAVREALPARGGLGVAEISLRSGQEPAECLAALAWLEQEEQVVCGPRGEWRLVRP